jgi:hypothetical protein
VAGTQNGIGSNISNQDVQNMANSNADKIEAQTGVVIDNNLVGSNISNQDVQNMANSNADIIEAQTGVVIDNNLVPISNTNPVSFTSLGTTFKPSDFQQFYESNNVITAGSFPNQANAAAVASFIPGNNFNSGNFQSSTSFATVPGFTFQGSTSATTLPVVTPFVDSSATSSTTGTGNYVSSANSFGYGFVMLADGTTMTSSSQSP